MFFMVPILYILKLFQSHDGELYMPKMTMFPFTTGYTKCLVTEKTCNPCLYDTFKSLFSQTCTYDLESQRV